MTPEQRFDQMSHGNYDAAKKLGYDAMGYMRKVIELGWLGAAKYFLTTDKPQAGFTTLWMKGALHRSVEALVVREEFRSLFTEAEIATAQRRLDEVGYVPDFGQISPG